MTTEQDLLQAVGAVSDSPSILAELTPSGTLTVGGYALGVSEVVLGLVGGSSGNPADLAAGATSLVASLVTDLVGAVFGAAVDSVPIVGQILGSVIGLLGELQEAEKADEARKKAEQEQACKEETLRWKTIGNGAWGQVLPADYFVQATRDHEDRWTIHREPFHGAFLRAILETSWPRWFAESFDGAAVSAVQRRRLGHDAIEPSAATSWSMWKSPIHEQVWLGLHQPERERYANADNWPPRPAELEITCKLLRGVAGQHPAVLAQSGRPLGEAGREVWPLFCDLLYFLCRVPRPPWWADGVSWENDPSVAALGLLPVPTLNEPWIRRFYSSPAASPLMDSASAPWVEWDRMRRFELPHLRNRGLPLGSCRGYGSAGCNLLFGLADGWRGFARPVTASDAETRDAQIREAWAWMEQHLNGHGPAKFLPGVIPRDKISAAIVHVANELGWSTQAQQTAHDIIEASSAPTTSTLRKATIAAALGAGAIGLAYAIGK